MIIMIIYLEYWTVYLHGVNLEYEHWTRKVKLSKGQTNKSRGPYQQ